MAFAREERFQLVAIWGLETQYMWTVWRKPVSAARPDASRVTVKGVTVSSGTGRAVPQRGRDACVSLWIAGFDGDADLSNLEIAFGDSRGRACYLSPIGEGGGAQVNARLPWDTPLGRVPVSLMCDGEVVPGVHTIEVVEAGMRPAIVDVTDAIHIGSKYRIETGGIKVTLEAIERPGEVSFHLKGREAEIVQIEFKDPVTLEYEFSFYLPHRTPKGKLAMTIRVSGRELDPVSIHIV